MAQSPLTISKLLAHPPTGGRLRTVYMRKFIRGAIVLVILVAAYWSWALIGTAQLASVASQGDAQAVVQRIDLPSLRRSLSSQIAYAYLSIIRNFRKCCR